MRAILIPQNADEPVKDVELEPQGDSCLDSLQSLVGGMIEALPWPGRDESVTCYINEEGKYSPECEYNARATALMAELLTPGDVIVGPLVVSAVDFQTGRTIAVPDHVQITEARVEVDGFVQCGDEE